MSKTTTPASTRATLAAVLAVGKAPAKAAAKPASRAPAKPAVKRVAKATAETGRAVNKQPKATTTPTSPVSPVSSDVAATPDVQDRPRKAVGRPRKNAQATPPTATAPTPSAEQDTLFPANEPEAPITTLVEAATVTEDTLPTGVEDGSDGLADDTAADVAVIDMEAVPAPPKRRRSAAAEARERADIENGIEDLWKTYKENKSRSDRDRLLLHYSPLVKYVAGRVGTGLPHTIEQADLVQYGIFGLMDAITKFEPERGLKFETYAISRIRGAIIDELRAVDWVPRSVRTKIREVEKAFVALETELNRTPTETEVAERLNMAVSDLRHIFSQVSFTNVVALDDLLHRGGDGEDAAVTLGERLSDDRVEQPGEALEDDESKRALADAVRDLPDRDRVVISLYYYEGLTLAEIGQVLGVTESRVCQLHTKATLALKAKLTSFVDSGV